MASHPTEELLLFHGERTVFDLSEEALHSILAFSLYDNADFEAPSFKEHLENCYTSGCGVTQSYVRQLNALRSTARDFRRFVNSMDDAFVCLRLGNVDQFAFEHFENVNQRLQRTMSIEIWADVLLPPFLTAFQTLLLSTPNVVRIAVRGHVVPFWALQATDILEECLAMMRPHAYPHFQSLVLDIPFDLSSSIRGVIDIQTIRLKWLSQQFTFSPPMSWNALRNLYLDLTKGNVPSDLLRILGLDSLPCVRKLEMHSDGETNQVMDVVRVVSSTVETLELFCNGEHPWTGVPSCPVLRKFSCYAYSARGFFVFPQPSLMHIDLHRNNGWRTDGVRLEHPFCSSTRVTNLFLQDITRTRDTVAPRLETISCLFIRPETDADIATYINMHPVIASWREYQAKNGGQFEVNDEFGNPVEDAVLPWVQQTLGLE